MYDVLLKLLNSDEENAPGDVQALCQLFYGEEASFRYATERMQEIAAYTAFCILGARRIPFAALVVALFKDMNAINSLEEFDLGKVRTLQVRYVSNPNAVFVKEEPEKVNWPTDLCSQSDYRARYNQTANKCITPAIKQALIDAEFIPQDMFPDV